MTPLPRVLLACLFACLGGCLAPIELEDGGGVSLAVTDPGLLEEIETLVVVLYYNQTGAYPCAELIDETPEALAARATDAQPVAAQEVAAKGPGHVFGNISASGDYSFLVLGSTLSTSRFGPEPLAAASGNVVAVGCEELRVLQRERYDLALTLFPAGLR